MGTIRQFEDLEIWQLARKLNKNMIAVLNKLESARNYDPKSQLDRSAGSIMDNIAEGEGFERNRTREFIQFLAISKASPGKTRSQLYRVLDRNYISKEDHDILQKDCLRLASQNWKLYHISEELWFSRK